MANPEHLHHLRSGVDAWNNWREENYKIKPDLSYADLRDVEFGGAYLNDADLSFANLSHAYLSRALLNRASLRGAQLPLVVLQDANLSRADLRDANLFHAIMSRTDLTNANFRGADLRDADLESVDLRDASLSGVDLKGANLIGANLTRANLSGANLRGAFLYMATLVESDLTGANLERAKIYGISAWNLKKEGIVQKDLVITKYDEPEITVDNLEVAQFIYLMLNNQNIRDVIDTITSKSVLILGRFTDERKAVLDALKGELRKRNYLPILFDFEKPTSRDLTETISILAKMSRFVIADLTDAKSIPQELSHIVPHTPSLPILPIILEGQREYGMFEHFKRYPWVLSLHAYQTPEAMLSEIVEVIIEPAERKVNELRGIKPPTH
ncbi:MAG: pentapeptide repeat-containing protein [Cyclobacteriaceae bacterium]|nr:pentapeptide repeat-containing protein [Cyclobacteriaceae bacterium]